MAEPPSKRRRLSDDAHEDHVIKDPGQIPASLLHPISPPRKKRNGERKLIPSPFQLTTIRDLPETANIGAVSLHDLLGDPLIAECWEFNYLHDVDFLMGHFDEDTRSLVKVHIVHGFWKRDDSTKILLEQQASQYDNVTLHTAFMPEMFGTHHSKMIVLFRHDDTAEVIIHTANMISKDWTNMTNGVWRTPPLPRLKNPQESSSQADLEIGSGARFKADLLSYLRAYNTRRDVCKALASELARYDFAAVRGALIASVPGKHDVNDDPSKTRWGWAGVKHALRSVPVQPGKSEVVVQISSIATLGATDGWLKRTLFNALSSSSPAKADTSKPDFKVVFPTPDEIRRSLDGYASGGSIHMKIQSSTQTKQLQYMRPLLHHWANDSERGVTCKLSCDSISPCSAIENVSGKHHRPVSAQEGGIRDAGRKRAAPHIKTYIRYGEKSIDWALLTSANISKQAWGEAANGTAQVRIASWEIGVLVWPELLSDGAKMVGTFMTDMPAEDDVDGDQPLVGLRIPYNLPLQRYGNNEVPWVATASYNEPDWMGRVWSV